MGKAKTPAWNPATQPITPGSIISVQSTAGMWTSMSAAIASSSLSTSIGGWTVVDPKKCAHCDADIGEPPKNWRNEQRFCDDACETAYQVAARLGGNDANEYSFVGANWTTASTMIAPVTITYSSSTSS